MNSRYHSRKNTIPPRQFKYFTEQEMDALESFPEEDFLDFFESQQYKNRFKAFNVATYLLSIDTKENPTSEEILGIISSTFLDTYSITDIIRKIENLKGKEFSKLTISVAKLLCISDNKV